MNKLQAAFLVFFMFSYATIIAQDKIANFGIKGGINYGKYTPNQNLRDYNYQVGFYIGGFYKIEITDKMKFQPELLFALQGSKINTKDNPITDFNGNPLPYTGTFDFEYQVYEFTISIPLPIKLYFSEAFYMESGPQFGFIIDRNLQSSQILLDGNDSSFIKKGNANFDFGVCLGTGYDVSDALSLNIRAFTGLIEREDIKSFVFNFGIEYNL
ncbi:outer membrane protein with beta-barrel domain [Winogradskyella pacifica]|uniref:Outer membrane protein with beta-barrel domain n=1 Tax=Winogradskyella pacifica TaxID=664642 RepID=A0A3D9MYV0_9FLAO|nr:porin family protein [Winogradskyella pacifica]REE24429.1 outer membrane protein with beta-barrel domain [Winogradskyella pacifica]